MADNYALQAQRAKEHFLTYDQEEILRRVTLPFDRDYFYPTMLGFSYRLCRKTGNLQKNIDGIWQDANSHGEVMTLLDWLCDSKADRFLTGRLAPMQSFGRQFHQNLLEDRPHPLALWIDRHPQAFQALCKELGCRELSGGDFGFGFELFDGLSIGLCFWFGDEEFLTSLRFFWDENATSYLRYETMYFAVGMLTGLLSEKLMIQ